MMQALFGKKLTPKEQAMKAKRETKKEVRVSLQLFLDQGAGAGACAESWRELEVLPLWYFSWF